MQDKKREHIVPEDWKYMEQKPYGDEGFSEEHNKRVIAEVDTYNDKMDKRRTREYKEKTKERTSAVAQYLRQLKDGSGIHSIDKYFGKRYLAYLRGREILDKLKANPVLLKKIKEKMSRKGSLQPL